jgi:hypothetical protein
MKFKSNVFERMLFSPNRQIYRQIQSALDEVDEKHPGQLQRIIEVFNKAAKTDTQTAQWMPGKADESLYPSLDIFILFSKKTEHKIFSLRKSTDCMVTFIYDEKPPTQFAGSHFILNFYKNSAPKTYIVPLEYFLGFYEKAVLKEGSYQLYSHSILSSDKHGILTGQIETVKKTADYSSVLFTQWCFQSNSLIYVGITRRTWQEWYRQHCRDSDRGSNLLFHWALRGEFCKIGTIEHIVERAGLTEKQAMEIEEREVEKRFPSFAVSQWA